MHYAALAGGFLAVIGSFLPWVSFGGIITWSGINSVNGGVVVAVGLCAIILAIWNLQQKTDKHIQVYAICGLLNLGIILFYVTEINRRFSAVGEGLELLFDIKGSFFGYIKILGTGIWFVIIGALVLIGAAILLSLHGAGKKSISQMFAGKDSVSSLPQQQQHVFSRKSFLTGITGSYAGQQIPIPTEGILIGRDPSQCTLVLNSSSVSRRHARLSPGPSPDYWILEDLNSTNGTFVQEGASWKRIASPVTVGIFRRIRLGDDGHEFEIG